MRNHVEAILWKQCKDTLKNKTVLIQFLMFPLMTVIMENAMDIPGMPEHFFANLFAVMYIGMAPLTCMAAIISEEKEKNTLRVLQMCNVKAMEYLLGNAVYIISMCMLGSLVIGLAGGYQGRTLVIFILVMLLGHSIAVLLGATIGAISKNQMMATSVTVPAMMVLSFLPMLSMFNETIGKVAKFVFSGQLYVMINNMEAMQWSPENTAILGGNVVLVLGVFLVAYKKAFA
ncbi:MAG: ABC transporter permease [Lachnospiraceae bacterium]|nr:ABC transporter permease [Lachnospiraceae bacterium]